jgi:hypothetical protein
MRTKFSMKAEYLSMSSFFSSTERRRDLDVFFENIYKYIIGSGRGATGAGRSGWDGDVR